MARRNYDILILGGGQAARRAAEGVRSVNRDATVAIVGDEAHLPYDRPPLSKEALIDGNSLSLCDIRRADSYASEGIDLFLSQRANLLDPVEQNIGTEDGDVFRYNRLVLATGSRPKTIPFITEPHEHISYLRTKEDSQAISEALQPGADIAIIGAGFIGLEVASAALAKGAKPTVIEAGDRVLGRVLPRVAGDHVEKLHREAGISFIFGESLKKIVREDDKIILHVGEKLLSADFVVIGIGVTPNLELAESAGLKSENGLIVSETGQTSDPNIFGAGEVTRHPVSLAKDSLRLESWQVAEQQAYHAGRTAAGQTSAHDTIPWFWSDQSALNLQLLGLFPEGSRIVRRIYDNIRESHFALDNEDRVIGLFAVNGGSDISVAKRMIGKSFDLAGLADAALPLRQILKAAS